MRGFVIARVQKIDLGFDASLRSRRQSVNELAHGFSPTFVPVVDGLEIAHHQ
jgi:hypothetical protein